MVQRRSFVLFDRVFEDQPPFQSQRLQHSLYLKGKKKTSNVQLKVLTVPCSTRDYFRDDTHSSTTVTQATAIKLKPDEMLSEVKNFLIDALRMLFFSNTIQSQNDLH